MKNIIFIPFILSMFQCSDSPPCKNENCVLYEPKIIDEWKLIEQCDCYSLGGDFVWREVSRDLIFIFDDECNMVVSGADKGVCDHGKYTINQDQLNIAIKCPSGGVTDNLYSYRISANNDTLTLKGYVDEGYVGSKFIRQ